MEIFLTERQFKDVFESHIKIETYSKSIDTLFNNIRSKSKIDYKPYYQRNYVWDDSKATYFIESILLGTEIPPLIFFDEGSKTEVIDGRQRFETIKRFIECEFSLTKNGLTSLIELQKMNSESLRSQMSPIFDAFLDAKVRIIEFKLVNNPPTDPVLIDKIKKEIFGRYNSGITPLKSAEIDNAVYNADPLSKLFKKNLKKDSETLNLICKLFLRQVGGEDLPNIETVLQFIRKSLVSYKFPIKTYASGKSRVELISKFYEHSFEDIDNAQAIYDDFKNKISIIDVVQSSLIASGIQTTRLFFECLLWGINVIDQEFGDYRLLSQKDNLIYIRDMLADNTKIFDLTDSHYAKETLNRYTFTAELFQKIFSIELSAYLQLDKNIKEILAGASTKSKTSSEELEKLESLRITKPDPSRNTIDDIVRAMSRSRFLVRPTYQRSEVINLPKSSAIIESILLGIMLPAIFIYKRKDGVSEVIDGQQRLLTILSFIGEKYLDENGVLAHSKNHNFKLKPLKILNEISGKGFGELSEELKNRILDFDLFVVEIEERLNPYFNPVDLFIRLNNKPYPIKENSFEMWNSWVSKDILEKIKNIFEKNKNWFYLTSLSNEKNRDRMLNEELITTLSYFSYRRLNNDKIESFLDIHQKGGRINARIKGKDQITDVLRKISEQEDIKIKFLACLISVGEFIDKLELLLVDPKGGSLKMALDSLVSSGTSRKNYSRTLQDFYILWIVLSNVSLNASNKSPILEDLRVMLSLMKKSSDDKTENAERLRVFKKKLNMYIKY